MTDALSKHQSDERGAALVVIAFAAVILVAVGAIALDLTAMSRRGQQLQNTTDAAALAGVAVWNETQSETKAMQAVEDLIRQNGELDADLELSINFPDSTQLEVVITDPSPDMFLSGGMLANGGITRGSIAELDSCVGCQTEIETAPPFSAILVQGAGDGFVPIPVRDRIYAINHHGDTIGCADRNTNGVCWAPRQILFGNTGTGNSLETHVFDEKIYFTGSTDFIERRPTAGSDVVITCFDTVTDSLCPTQRTLVDHGRALLAGIGNRLYAFTMRHQAFCYELPSLTPCTGYSGGLHTATAALGDRMPPYAMEWGDTEVFNGRVYLSWFTDRQVHMSCWDTMTSTPCAGFGVKLLDGDIVLGGRLFMHRDATGMVNGVCAMSAEEVECFDHWSGEPTEQGEAFDELTESRARLTGRGTTGSPEYSAASNRFFVAGGVPDSHTWCWDFATGYCGVREDMTPWGPAVTYGYEAQGDCLLAFGHESVFFSFTENMVDECTKGTAEQDFVPCMCTGTATWPPLYATNLEDLRSFVIQIRRADGSLVVPSDGTEWHEMIDDPVIDLSALLPPPLPNEVLTIRILADPEPGMNPWADGQPPTLVVSPTSTHPALVD